MVVKGEVKLEGPGKPATTTKVGGKILPGETVIAGKDSRAKIVMSDRNVINVSPDTKMQIAKYENNSATGVKNVELNLIEGKVRNNVEQKYDGEKSKFMIKTPTAVAGVRGTQFVTSFDPQTKLTQIVTMKGAVALTAMVNGKPSGAPVLVKKGETSSLAQGQASPEPAKALPKEELNKIDKESTQGPAKKEESSTASDSGGKDDKKEKDGESKDGKGDSKSKDGSGADSKDSKGDGKGDAKSDGKSEDSKSGDSGSKKSENREPSSEPSMIDAKDMDTKIVKEIAPPNAPPPIAPPPPIVTAPPKVIPPYQPPQLPEVIKRSKVIIVPKPAN